MSAPRYRVLRMIGRGGMAEVLEAVAAGENGFERRVALKRLLADCAKDEEFLAAFSDEARIAGQLHHAGIVAVFDYGLIDGLPFIASELVEGLDVAELEERARASGRRVPAALALFIATEIAHALEYAHSAKDAQGRSMGIVHRDVSPENILVSWQGDVKLADFGIAFAKRRIQATRIGVAKGKPSFMAPEQIELRDVDGRADLFALGVVLARLVDPSDAEVRAIVERATKADRRERFATGAEMAAQCGRLMMARLGEDARTAMRAFMRELGAPSQEAPAMRAGADLLDVMLVLDGPVKRFESRAGVPIVEEEAAEPPEPETELTRAEVVLAEREEAQEHLIGQVIGNYRVEELLGAGASARVYRARHEVLDRPCALKVLHGKTKRRDRLAARLKREAKALAAINHVNVVRVLDCGTTPSGLPYLASELCEGRSLRAVMREEWPLAPARVARFARQIAAGLQAAHAQGFIHRDLKPGNVMILAGDTVKIVDFGLSRVFGPDDSRGDETQLTKASDRLGTPAYMSPEQAADPTKAGPSSDLYALGVMIYELLTGARPPGPSIANLPLGAIAERLMAADPSARFRDAQAVIDALDGPRRRPRSWMPAFIATAIAGVIFGVWMTTPEDQAPAVQAVLPPPAAQPKVSAVAREPEPEIKSPEPETKTARPAPVRPRARTETEAAPQISIDPDQLRQALAEVKATLERRADELDRPTLDRLEARWFELRNQLRNQLGNQPGAQLPNELDLTRAAELAAAIDALRREATLEQNR